MSNLKPLATSHSRGNLERLVNEYWPGMKIKLEAGGKLRSEAKPEQTFEGYKWDNKNGRFRFLVVLR